MAMQGASARKAETAPRSTETFTASPSCWTRRNAAVARQLRDFMETEVAPVIKGYWARDRFSFEIIPGGPAG